MGKLPNEELKRLLGCIKHNPQVVVPPQLGFDAGVHHYNEDEYLVVSTDPCIGVPPNWFGWFLINYVASDIALFGAKTRYCTINLLGPKSTKPETFHQVMQQACKAADELGIAIVTGHTGTYRGVSALVGVCTGYGTVKKEQLKTPAGAKPEDCILCVKPVGLETVVNFALVRQSLAERLFGTPSSNELAKLVDQQSCVKEALALAQISGAHAMHDATEGGVISALNEVAEASDVGFTVDWSRFVFPKQVQILKKVYNLSLTQLLSMSSTGTFLAAVAPEAKDKVESVLLQTGVNFSFLGCFTKKHSRILVKDGKKTVFPQVADDPYADLLEKKM